MTNPEATTCCNYSNFVLPHNIFIVPIISHLISCQWLEAVTFSRIPQGHTGSVCPLAWPPWPLSKCFHYLSVQPSASLSKTPVCNQRRHISFWQADTQSGHRPTVYVTDWFGRFASTGVASSWSSTTPANCYPCKTDQTSTLPVKALPYRLCCHQP